MVNNPSMAGIAPDDPERELSVFEDIGYGREPSHRQTWRETKDFDEASPPPHTDADAPPDIEAEDEPISEVVPITASGRARHPTSGDQSRRRVASVTGIPARRKPKIDPTFRDIAQAAAPAVRAQLASTLSFEERQKRDQQLQRQAERAKGAAMRPSPPPIRQTPQKP